MVRASHIHSQGQKEKECAKECANACAHACAQHIFSFSTVQGEAHEMVLPTLGSSSHFS